MCSAPGQGRGSYLEGVVFSLPSVPYSQLAGACALVAGVGVSLQQDPPTLEGWRGVDGKLLVTETVTLPATPAASFDKGNDPSGRTKGRPRC